MPRHPEDNQGTDDRTETVDAMIVALAETPSGGEDLTAIHSGKYGGWMPLACTSLASEAAVDKLKRSAQKIASETGRTIRVVRFSAREVLETFEP